MSTSQTITLNGIPVIRMELCVPNIGVWFCDITLNQKVILSGNVEIVWGDSNNPLKLRGTIRSENSGSFLEQSSFRVVAGSNGWGKYIGRKSYHNDAGVNAKTVASDVAAEVGETIGSFEPVVKFGPDYIRRTCQASRVLEDCAMGVPWWIDYSGKTNIGARPATTPSPEAFRLLDYNPATHEASIGLEDAQGVVIGSTITDDRLDTPLVIRELHIVSEGNSLSCRAWFGENESQLSKLSNTLKQIATRATDQRIWGRWRYRVLSTASDGRINLQAFNKSSEVPDQILVKQWASVAGAYCEPTPGAIVLVEFLEGNPALPIVTPGSATNDPKFAAERVTLGANKSADGSDAARKGDTIEGLLPPATFVGTISGQPATGVVIWAYPKVLGSIVTGSTKIGIAT